MLTYLFTDWQKLNALKNKNYPQRRIMMQKIPLLSLEHTEQWLTQRLDTLERLDKVPQKELPYCSPTDLWQEDSKFKYFADSAKASPENRSTRTFKTLAEAEGHRQKAGFGVVLTVPGKAKHCQFCSAKPICSQAEDLASQGLLVE